MKKGRNFHIRICVFLVVSASWLTTLSGYSQNLDFRGQLSGYTSLKPEENFQTLIGGRYIPELSLTTTLNEHLTLDGEFSANIYGTTFINTFDTIESNGRIKPYRVWMRLSGDQFEVRLGLQKINFGSASMLRPLMWFDQIDPRDPLQITDGVYGLLFRYYFLNNANIWLWGLYGNNDPKGWETLPTYGKIPEFGGRFQFPVSTGEMGLSYHHRNVDLEKNSFPEPISSKNQIPENRIAVDGKWDIGIGLWFEGVFVHKKSVMPSYKFTQMLNLGIDYTFGLGNGINTTLEQLTYGIGEDFPEFRNSTSFTAFLVNYPISIVPSITGIVFYDWNSGGWYRFVNLQLVYDKWSFYFMAFWNPDQYKIYADRNMDSFFAGKGIQIMAVFNH